MNPTPFQTDAPACAHDTDVAIVGAGPVGTLLAILLGQRGHKVTLIERWTRHYSMPRAVTYDHEIARILAMLGIDSEDDPAVNHHDALYYWRNRDGQDLQIVDWQSQSASGWRVRYWFNQPLLEKRLLALAETIPSVTILRGWTGTALDQDADGVTLSIRQNPEEYGPDGKLASVRARYLAGTDGANSFVRNSLGIENEDRGYFFDWLILDMIPDFDYCASRPHEPSQWQLCDPARPTTIVPGGPGPAGHDRRRWEFMVLPGESVEDLQRPDTAWKLLEPWGLTPGNADLERAAVYRFQARWATQWNKGRCVIGGDAAHLMPPFAGEGMCAGLRDALAMAWRLDMILDGKAGPRLLDSYTTERKEHAKHYISFSQELGDIICIADQDRAAQRDHRMIADLADRAGQPVATDICHLGPGAWSAGSAHAGELSVQGVVEHQGRRGRFDQTVGHGWMLIGHEADPMAALDPGQRERLAALGGRAVSIGQPGSAAEVIDSQGTYARWLAGIDARYVLIRPDFYVAATASTAESLRHRFDEVMGALDLRERQTAAA